MKHQARKMPGGREEFNPDTKFLAHAAWSALTEGLRSLLSKAVAVVRHGIIFVARGCE
ncbi:hypothetical protein [Paraburkholderia sp. GAS334]|uniref:hypothetical protein n=1 Tax=Paraburkholderia sp. GAS334 TaxID=3035131 RepID=UPI003D1E6B3A